MELGDFEGEYTLDACDRHNSISYEDDEDCQALRFRLDGRVYVAIEDPHDGYRSSMKEIVELEQAEMWNQFQPVRVLAHPMINDSEDINGILEHINPAAGH